LVEVKALDFDCAQELAKGLAKNWDEEPSDKNTNNTTNNTILPNDWSDKPFGLRDMFSSNTSKQDYINRFNRTQAYIQQGDCYQINLSQCFSAQYTGAPINAYTALSKACPTPFSGYMRNMHDTHILSLSPERFISFDGHKLESKPIKGTRPRGKNAEEDAALAIELKNSPKDRAENLMIVDLLRNDLSKHAIAGSVKVPKLFDIEHYPNVHHLVSTVTAEIKPSSTPLTVLLDAFPGGSSTGAPKKRAMEIIDELEPVNRSFYCGSMGYISLTGKMDSNIMIRTLICQNGTIKCWGGGGIVADSEVESEYQESITKVKILLDTLEML
jgi:para-aminobenzoate synthetase component 1